MKGKLRSLYNLKRTSRITLMEYIFKILKGLVSTVVSNTKEMLTIPKALSQKIIDENLIISFSDFSKIFLKNLKNSSYFFEIQPRLGWYYQQVIKISFVVDFVKEKLNDPKFPFGHGYIIASIFAGIDPKLIN